MIDRRTFLAGTGAVLLAAPLAAEADHGRKVYRIGFLSSLPIQPSALSEALRRVGLIERYNVVVDRRLAQGPEELPALAVELVGLRPDVIVAYWNRDVVAARDATRSIPIVMVVGVDPVGSGLVTSLARPGANVTGSLVTEPSIAGKTLEVLKQTVPSVGRVAVLWNPSFTLPAYYQAMEKAAQASGIALLSIESRTPADFEPALARLSAVRPHALFVDGLAVPKQTDRDQLVKFVAQRRLPTVYTAKHWVVAGGFLSYNASLDEAWSRTGTYVAKILRGASPSDLPVEGPTKFELVINLKTAKALGLTIPLSVLARADEAIQ